MKIAFAGIDSETIRNITLKLKELQLDWDLSVASSGNECLDMLKTGNSIDVIITATKLPDMTGFKLTSFIRNDSDIPIVIVSNDNDIKTLVKAFDSGANDCIFAPFNKSIFVARLKALIRRRDWDNRVNKKESKRIYQQQIVY